MPTAVVTGGGRGLGLAIAQRLAARGLAVLITDLDAEAADRAARSLGTPAWSAGLDVRDPSACRAVAREAGARGGLSVWVNNAGVLFSGPAWELSDAEVELTVAVNLMGVVHGSRAALEQMADGGRILNVASLSAPGLAPGLAAYAASKHGVLAFGTSLAADLHAAGRRIGVRTLCPDVIDTQMVRDQLDTPEAAILWSGPAPLASTTSPTGPWPCLTAADSARWFPPGGALLRLLYRFPRLAAGTVGAGRARPRAPRALAAAGRSLNRGCAPGYWPAVRATYAATALALSPSRMPAGISSLPVPPFLIAFNTRCSSTTPRRSRLGPVTPLAWLAPRL